MFFRTLVTTLSACLAAATALAADTAPKTAYTATVTGVVCASCRAHVETAVKKLPGVENVTFQKGFKDDTQEVHFASSSASLAKEDVIKALGDDAQTYQVVALNKDK